MSADAAAELEAFVKAQRVRFIEGLPARLAVIEGEWRAMKDAPADPAAPGRLALAAHSLAGAAPLFGLEELGQAARALQQEAEALAAARTSLAERSAAIDAALHRLGASARG